VCACVSTAAAVAEIIIEVAGYAWSLYVTDIVTWTSLLPGSHVPYSHGSHKDSLILLPDLLGFLRAGWPKGAHHGQGSHTPSSPNAVIMDCHQGDEDH
jgi:hypothetical protein